MANVKASDVVTVRGMAVEKGAETVQRITAALEPEVARLFQQTSATVWIPFAAEGAILQAAAGVFYPQDPRQLETLGREVARRDFTGIYKVFLSMATVAFIVKRAGLIFRTFYDGGDIRIENLASGRGSFVIVDLPDLTAVQRRYIGGFLTGLLELTQAKDVRVTRDEQDPRAWRWHLTWR